MLIYKFKLNSIQYLTVHQYAIKNTNCRLNNWKYLRIYWILLNSDFYFFIFLLSYLVYLFFILVYYRFTKFTYFSNNLALKDSDYHLSMYFYCLCYPSLTSPKLHRLTTSFISFNPYRNLYFMWATSLKYQKHYCYYLFPY